MKEKIYVGVFLDKVRERKRKKKFSLHPSCEKVCRIFQAKLTASKLVFQSLFFW